MKEQQEWAEAIWKKTEDKMEQVVLRNRDIIPYTTGEDGRYIDIFERVPAMWTNGFWPGILWYLFQATGKDLYREEALRAEEKLDGPLFAMAHADHTMSGLLRSDGSSAHIAVYDVDTGAWKEHLEGQGAAFDSSWSRGQGWAIYGFALSFRYTKKQEYLDAAKRTAAYFWSCVSVGDGTPKSDFRGEKNLTDTTAGVIAACGMMEIAAWVPKQEASLYRNMAFGILKAMEKHCCWTLDSDAILQNSSERYTDDHEMTIIYGDFFLIEAILRLKECGSIIW